MTADKQIKSGLRDLFNKITDNFDFTGQKRKLHLIKGALGDACFLGLQIGRGEQPIKLYTKEQVYDMMCEFMNYPDKNIQMDFEKRLNERGLNSNNGDHEELYDDFIKHHIESFIY